MPQGPLSNLKVVEMGTLIAGPYCARLLAEFGAEVIKIETPGEGDPLRKWRKLHEGNSLWWYAQARNKKSVAVNLRDPEGQAVVRALAKGADIVIENFRPGTLEKMGLAPERLLQIHPKLVIVTGAMVVLLMVVVGWQLWMLRRNLKAGVFGSRLAVRLVLLFSLGLRFAGPETDGSRRGLGIACFAVCALLVAFGVCLVIPYFAPFFARL